MATIPNETQSEILDRGNDAVLKTRIAGDPDISPGATTDELRQEVAGRGDADLRRMEEKEARKNAEASAMQNDRESDARAWSPAKAGVKAGRDVAEHKDFEALGKRGEGDAYYLRSDMAMQSRVNPAYDAALKAASPELHQRVQDNEKGNVTVNVQAAVAAAGAAGPAGPAVSKAAELTENQAALNEKGLKEQLTDDLLRRKAKETELAGQGLNSVDVQRSGKELDKGEFITPRRITQAYSEVDGKFFAKDAKGQVSTRVMFEDKGDKLATSSTDKTAIADMVTFAKAKQWDSLKLSGSQEFRREAWLQAESQGIKTQGYTPKDNDLAALKALQQERSTNLIVPVAERKVERVAEVAAKEAAAPRHDLNKNQAVMHDDAKKAIAVNLQALQKQPALADKSVEDLTKLAYFRGIVAEQNKGQTEAVKTEAVARFDTLAADPQFVKRLTQETEPKIEDKTTERVQNRDTHEQSM